LRIALGKWETASRAREAGQTWSFRGSKSRNKVSVGEPAEGSLTHLLGGVLGAPAPAPAVEQAPPPPEKNLQTHTVHLSRQRVWREPARSRGPHRHGFSNVKADAAPPIKH